MTSYEVGVAWTVVSDRNLKKNIEANTLGLDFIRQLRPVTYEYKAHEKSYRYTGLIAQEVEETLAKMRKESSILASPSKGDGSYGIRYAELTIPLIQSVQEQQTQIETLQKENAELKARLDRIEKMLSDKK
jgi:trimeric autotransporter adhesin